MNKYLGKKKLNYLHKYFHIGKYIRIAFFKLHKKWTLRVELSDGWN